MLPIPRVLPVTGRWTGDGAHHCHCADTQYGQRELTVRGGGRFVLVLCSAAPARANNQQRPAGVVPLSFAAGDGMTSATLRTRRPCR